MSDPVCLTTKDRMVWHYTAGVYVRGISDCGFIKPSNANAPNELPLIWYSSNQYWEPTATKAVRTPEGTIRLLKFEEQAKTVGCVRFGLPASDTRLMNWKSACDYAGTPKSIVRGMEKVGKEQGASSHQWWAICVEVPFEEHKFEHWDGSKWSAK